MRRSALFPGWYVVAAAHLLLALIFGAAYSFGAFFTHMQAVFETGRFSVASIFSLTAFIYYAVGVFSGALADRISTRLVVGLGIVSLALGFFLGSLTTGSLWLFLLCFCSFVGLGVGLVYVPAVAAVQRWFVRQRSRASGIALAGTGLGTFIGPALAGLLLQQTSWETTLRVFALGILCLGLMAAMLMRGSPEELGLFPDGERPLAAPTAVSGIGLGEAVRGGRFWYYFLAIFLGSVGLFLALVHINPYAQQLGVEAAQANLLIGLIGIGNLLGRFCLGSLGDRLGPLRLLVGLTLALALLNLGWLVADGWWLLASFAVLFGVANGGCISLYPAVAANWFGSRRLGAILGALYLSVGLAAIAGGSLGGLLFDLRGSYALSIGCGAACALLSALLLVAAGRGRPVTGQLSAPSGA